MDEEERAAANPQIEQDQKHDRSFDGCDLHVDGLRWHIEISHEENYVTDNDLCEAKAIQRRRTARFVSSPS